MARRRIDIDLNENQVKKKKKKREKKRTHFSPLKVLWDITNNRVSSKPAHGIATNIFCVEYIFKTF